MERNSNLITCPITEELREELGITEDSILEAHYADEEIIISVVDEDEYETVDLNEVEESGDLEGSYTLGRLAGQIDGFKEGYREGYRDGFADNSEKICCRNCHHDEKDEVDEI
jgi:hypothetical protein